MDSITQAVLGGLMGEIVLGRKLGYKGILWGVVFGTLPDLDVLAGPFLDEAAKLRNHRGITHSLLAIALMPFLFGPLLSRVHKVVSWQRASWFVFLAWATHVLIDCFNTYGTQILEPFSDQRIVLGNLSIIDPLFTVPIILSLTVALFLKREGAPRQRWWIGTTTWLLTYVGLSFWAKNEADKIFHEELTKRGVTPLRTMSGPSFGNIILWRAIAETENEIYVSYWSLWDRIGKNKTRPYEMVKVEKNHQALNDLTKSNHIETITWFCQDWHAVVTDDQNQIAIIDMRMGEMITSGQRAPVFSWLVDAEGMRMGAYRGLVSPKAALASQWRRMWNGEPSWDSARWFWQRQEDEG